MQQAMEYIDYTDQVQVDYSHLQKSKLKFKKGQRAKSVYHYTSIGGLESILRNKTLRFTNIKYMNDKDEIIAGLDSIAKDCNASDEVREQMRLAITNLGMQLFVCCFSLKEDSLPMWNYYTKEINSQGYNIEFDDKKLVESILRSNPVLDGCSFSFGNVDYSKDNDSEYSHILTNGLLSSMEVAISKIFLAVVTEMSKKQASGIDQSALRELEKKVSDSEREQKLDKGKSGEHLTTIPPYGYMKSPEDKKKWIVDEEAAAVVQKIFSLCASGKGPMQIAKWLKQQQILNPTAYCHAKGLPTSNKPTADPYKWTNETVSRILERVDYLGHTVNFKTTKQSYKSKKKIWNDPADWVIFENTQPPIIEESVFLIVQNIRKARRRPTKMGEMGMFSGLLYCAECGGKMYQCRATNFAENQKYFICSTYRKGKDLCTTHSIKNVVLHEIVLRNLREAISYVSEHEAEFIQDAAESDMRDRDAEFVRKRETLAKADTRIAELDRIISRLYEDNVIGKLSDERFIKMSHDYELEQSNLKSMAEVLRKDLKQQEQQKTNVKAFIAAVKKYTDLQELDAAVLRAFIDRIEVSHVDKKSRTREITIVYNFIGAFDFTRAIENARNTSKKEQRTA